MFNILTIINPLDVNIYKYIYIYTERISFLYIRRNMYIIYTHIYLCIISYTRDYIWYTYVYIHMYIYICVYIYIHTYTYVHMYVYIYIQCTYIYIYTCINNDIYYIFVYDGFDDQATTWSMVKRVFQRKEFSVMGVSPAKTGCGFFGAKRRDMTSNKRCLLCVNLSWIFVIAKSNIT